MLDTFLLGSPFTKLYMHVCMYVELNVYVCMCVDVEWICTIHIFLRMYVYVYFYLIASYFTSVTLSVATVFQLDTNAST